MARSSNLWSISLLALALCALAPSVGAAEVHCDVESDYDVTLNERSLIFTRDDASPKALVMRQGKLFVDDQWVSLDAGDSERLRQFEEGFRQTMPLAAEVAADAVDIAFSALGEVAAGLGNDPASTRKKLEQARVQMNTRMARDISPTHFSEKALGESIGQTVAEVLPTLTGDIVGGALAAALSGDSERLERMQNLDQEIEARLAPRTKALEGRAQKLCDSMLALDRLDNALAYRLPDGRALELLRHSPDQSDTSGKH
ncbi:DUF2884 family protein [Pseudoxanthomonas dokdonensis]|uniref:DUF2884 domain-containing protein n=1 Tax=Pseudoxanthomonas dokdonensis TaxID=344882 RepID=A0A0R0CZ94_9GAMM|nr:DUF2884 family protein [Pseudoxanthomonas dokdonensis]KRG71738.1 hypothetical protein ABB29_02535 [Pseudoxanthomonas dokdonensis]